jgi:hypothetical protein
MSHLITLRHASPSKNLASIFRRGLSPAFARGKLRCCWLHSSGRTRWAVPHVADRHHVAPVNVVVFTVRIPRGWLRRRARGVWACDRVIRPACIVSVLHPLAVLCAG